MDVKLSDPVDRKVSESGGLRLHVVSRQTDGRRLPSVRRGTRSVSVFLVNNRPPAPGSPDDAEVPESPTGPTRSRRSSKSRAKSPSFPGPTPAGWRL